MDEMCKDVKRVLQTVVKIESTITDLREEIEDLAFQQTRMQAQIREYTRQQAAVSGNGDEQSLVSESSVFLPPQLQESSPSQLFLAPETLPSRPSEPSSSRHGAASNRNSSKECQIHGITFCRDKQGATKKCP